MNKGILRLLLILPAIALLITGAILLSSKSQKDPTTEGYTQDNVMVETMDSNPRTELDASKVWELVQGYRSQIALEPFIQDDSLCPMAINRVAEIQSDWSHNGAYDDIEALYASGAYTRIGENLGKDYTDEEMLLAEWSLSETHLENLTSTNTHSCIKCEGLYCVQVFATY